MAENERYTRVFQLPKDNLYTVGAPVIIIRGALLKDNKKNNVLVQLKLQSICEKEIKALMVTICPFDISGKMLGNDVEYQYLDLTVQRDDLFGDKTPIILPDNTTRSYTVTVREVVFADRTVWSSDNQWEMMELPEAIDIALGRNRELIKQYNLDMRVDAKCLPFVYKDLWYCACGAINRSYEEKCHNNECQASKDVLFNTSIEEIKTHREERLKRECEEAASREKKEAEEKEKEDAEKKARLEEAEIVAIKNRKRMKAIVFLVAVLTGITVAIIIVKMTIIPGIRYNSAKSFLDNGNYEEAIEIFSSLNGFKDSRDQANICQHKIDFSELISNIENGKYVNSNEWDSAIEDLEEFSDFANVEEYISYAQMQKGLALLESGEYDDAIEVFEMLGNYDGAEENIKAAKYKKGENLIESKDYENALTLFTELGDYQESEAYSAQCESIQREIQNAIEDRNFDYMEQHLTQFRILDETEIREVIIGEWQLVCYFSEGLKYYNLTITSDGLWKYLGHTVAKRYSIYDGHLKVDYEDFVLYDLGQGFYLREHIENEPWDTEAQLAILEPRN